MQNNKNILLKFILGFSIIGVLFAGFLTVTKLLLGVCPLKEPCPILLGYPVCIYGLIFFTTILISTILLMLRKHEKKALKILTFVSVFAVAFSLYYSYTDLFVTCAGRTCEYSLGLPSCVYGLLMYTIIMILAIKYKRAQNKLSNSKKSNSRSELNTKNQKKKRRK
jgi:uncharacterized membrane protein